MVRVCSTLLVAAAAILSGSVLLPVAALAQQDRVKVLNADGAKDPYAPSASAKQKAKSDKQRRKISIGPPKTPKTSRPSKPRPAGQSKVAAPGKHEAPTAISESDRQRAPTESTLAELPALPLAKPLNSRLTEATRSRISSELAQEHQARRSQVASARRTSQRRRVARRANVSRRRANVRRRCARLAYACDGGIGWACRRWSRSC